MLRRRLTFPELESVISGPRAERFLDATTRGGTRPPDHGKAVTLYERNAQISGRYWTVISDIEIAVRNALADAFRDHHAQVRGGKFRWYDGPSWFPNNRGWLTSKAQRSIRTAMTRVGDGGPASATRPSEGRVIAELSFGFWRYMTVARYEHTLWNPAARSRFPGLSQLSGSDSRDFVAWRMEALHLVRNRIAHHEPIYEPFTSPQGSLMDPLVALAGGIEVVSKADHRAGEWIRDRSPLRPSLIERVRRLVGE